MAKEIIPLREKTLKDGRKSLYLDCYKNGRRTYEFLHLYLLPGNDAYARAMNKRTMEVARTIQAERITAIQTGKAKMLSKVREVTFNELAMEYADMPRISKSYRQAIIDCLHMWNRCFKHDVFLTEIDRHVLNEYIKRMKTVTYGKHVKRFYTASSLYRYWQNTVVLLGYAVHEGYLERNPVIDMQGSERLSPKGTERCFLDLDELRALAEARCGNEMVKRAFMFSCFTGLRISDMERLKWSDISGDKIDIIQYKTGGRVVVPLSENAKEWLPARKDQYVFHLVGRSSICDSLRRWAREAGLTKHVTMHVARHTFATMVLTYGADLYTVSKLLGHASIHTTQIYAKVVDAKKLTAVNLIPKL